MARILLALDDVALAAALRAAGHVTTVADGDLRIAADVERGLPSLVVLADDSTDRIVAALQAGADDVVPTTASPAEIVARVEAILRRTRRTPPVAAALRFGDLTLDEARHEAFVGEQPIELTGTEFRLLRYFLLNPRRVLSKSQLLQAVWESDTAHRSNVVETYVAYLRRKVGSHRITTVRQAGYMLDDR